MSFQFASNGFLRLCQLRCRPRLRIARGELFVAKGVGLVSEINTCKGTFGAGEDFVKSFFNVTYEPRSLFGENGRLSHLPQVEFKAFEDVG